jgi:dihydrofolate synthase/folylpolyglutamate synthase
MRTADRGARAWSDYRQALGVLNGELLRGRDEVVCALSRRDRRPEAHRVAGELFRELGDPQRAYPAIHVTGTSGKGSVCWAIAHLLRSAGLRVGLHVSPYLQVATEKIWIDGRYIDGSAFARIVARMAPAVRRYRTDDCPATVHGMASAAVAFEAFRRARVDVAVIEACCGGRFDVTAHLRTRVAVVTSVGDDHLDVLGPTVRDVAWHKAGILRRGAAAVSGVSGPAREVVRREARSLGVALHEVPTRGRNVVVANRELARAAVAAFGARPLETSGLPVFPGRLETVSLRPRVVLDVAHNPQKARGLVRSLPPAAGRTVLVAGVLRGKHPAELFRALARRCRSVVFTEPDVRGKPAYPAEELLAAFGPLFEDAAARSAAARALGAAIVRAGSRGTVLVTGSAYLVGALRGRWYPDRRVLVERSSWPGRTAFPT